MTDDFERFMAEIEGKIPPETCAPRERAGHGPEVATSADAPKPQERRAEAPSEAQIRQSDGNTRSAVSAALGWMTAEQDEPAGRDWRAAHRNAIRMLANAIGWTNENNKNREDQNEEYNN